MRPAFFLVIVYSYPTRIVSFLRRVTHLLTLCTLILSVCLTYDSSTLETHPPPLPRPAPPIFIIPPVPSICISPLFISYLLSTLSVYVIYLSNTLHFFTVAWRHCIDPCVKKWPHSNSGSTSRRWCRSPVRACKYHYAYYYYACSTFGSVCEVPDIFFRTHVIIYNPICVLTVIKTHTYLHACVHTNTNIYSYIDLSLFSFHF